MSIKYWFLRNFYEVFLQNTAAFVITKYGNFCLMLRKIAFYEMGQSLLQTETGITKQGNFIAKCESFYKSFYKALGAFFSKFCVLECINSFKWLLISPLSFSKKKQVEANIRIYNLSVKSVYVAKRRVNLLN